MADFDESKAYAEQEKDGKYFDDGREIELLHYVHSKPNIDEIRGNPQLVLDAIDEYGRQKKYLMNVGRYKAKYVTDLMVAGQTQTMVECGGYVGYSTVLFGQALREVGGKHYYSLERNPEFAAVIMALVELAGLSDIVKVIVGPSDRGIKRLYDQGIAKIDLLFLDHHKPAYVTDLKLAESLGMIQAGSIIAADNVISPGNPPYLEYVRSNVDQKRQAAKESAQSPQNGHLNTAGFTSTELGLYKKRFGDENFDPSLGNPSLSYESHMLEGPEPTGEWDGIEITRCQGVKST